MSDLTLPGSLPGLLRRGSPVVDVSGRSCVIVRLRADERATAADDGATDGPPATFPESLDALALDLTDATGRAHAAWWLANASGLWDSDEPREVLWRRPDPHDEPGWWLESHESVIRWVVDAHEVRENYARRVPTLSDLDPDDPCRLPDGSRLVDAIALRAVVLHVAGGTS